MYKKKLFPEKEIDFVKLRRDLDKANLDYSKLLEDYFSGKIIEEVFKKKGNIFKAKISEIEACIAEENEVESRLHLFDLRFKKFLNQLKSSPRDKLSLIQSVISKVYINKIVSKEELDLTIVYKIEEF